MESGKIRKFNKVCMITSLMLLAFSCKTFAEDIELPNPAKFEPAQVKTTAEINTETSRDSETRNIPTSDIPIPEIANSFFAPIDAPIPETLPEPETESVFKPIEKHQTITEEALPILQPVLVEETSESPLQQTDSVANQIEQSPQIGFNELCSQIDDNPFKIMNNITLPSEYKSTKTLPKNINTSKTESDSSPQAEDASYVSSAVEEASDITNECEGKTISKIYFKGIFYIREKVLSDIIKTHEGSKFNYQRIQNDLQNVYALGYFKDNMYVEPELQKNGDVTLTFVLEENITVKKAEIRGNTVITPKELRPFIERLEGLPQNLNLINESIEKINKYYEEKGYILAKVTNVEDNADGNLIFDISEGIIEELNIEGNEKTKEYIIKRNILTEPGSVYNEEIIKKDLCRIYAAQIFDKVDREIKPSPDKDGEYIVTVKVKEGSSNNINIGLGVDNALGGFGSVSYNEKNLFGRNQKLSLSGMLGSGLLLSDASIKNRMNWNLELNFFEPRFLNENNTFASKLYYRDLGSYQVPLAIERRWGFNNTIEHKVRDYDNLTTSFALGYENIRLKEGDYGKIAEMYRRSNIDFSKRREQLKGGSFINIAPGIKFSTLDNELMPREGLIAKANFVESLGLTSTKRTNGRLLGSITKYIPIAKKSTLLVGAKGGLKVHGNNMPEVMAFRLGGPYTIRGFRMNGVGSGESFVMASTELQTPIPFMDKIKYDFFKNLRFAFFVDAGRVFDPTITSTLFDRPLSAITVGAGLRINIPGMSTITVDYGVPLTHTGQYSSKHGYFTFGTGGLYDSY